MVAPYELPFDASYYGLQQSECYLWHVKPLAYLRKRIKSTNKKLAAGLEYIQKKELMSCL